MGKNNVKSTGGRLKREGSNAWKGGTICIDAHIYVHFPGHPNASMSRKTYVARARLVMSEYLGRPLTSKEIIHHIDGNPKNDELSNLQIVTRKEHMKIHAKEKGGYIGRNAKTIAR